MHADSRLFGSNADFRISGINKRMKLLRPSKVNIYFYKCSSRCIQTLHFFFSASFALNSLRRVAAFMFVGKMQDAYIVKCKFN